MMFHSVIHTKSDGSTVGVWRKFNSLLWSLHTSGTTTVCRIAEVQSPHFLEAYRVTNISPHDQLLLCITVVFYKPGHSGNTNQVVVQNHKVHQITWCFVVCSAMLPFYVFNHFSVLIHHVALSPILQYHRVQYTFCSYSGFQFPLDEIFSPRAWDTFASPITIVSTACTAEGTCDLLSPPAQGWHSEVLPKAW